MFTVYGKLFQQMYDGTLATHGPWQAMVTFQQLIILADKDGVVDMTSEAIARRTTIPHEIIKVGIVALEQRDSESRTPTEEGRRIVRLSAEREWGWRIVNHAHYRRIRSQEERREYMRLYQQRRRAANPSLKKQQRAYRLVFEALNQGRLQQGKCEICGTDQTEAHHDDYDKPLVVRWLCRQHHRDEHVNQDVNVVNEFNQVQNAGSSTSTKTLSAFADGAFQKFWKAYPRKTARAKALTAFRRLRLDAALVEAILAALEAHKGTEQWLRGVIPHAATWLNQRRWEDELGSGLLGVCTWNVNGTREPGKPKCEQPATVEKNGVLYCRIHAQRVN